MNKISQIVPVQYDTPFSPFKAHELDFALDFLEARGFTGIELAVAYPARIFETRLIKQLEAHHLTTTTLSTGQIYGLEGLCLSSFDENVRKRAGQIIKEHVNLSAVLGFPPVTVGLIRGKLEKGERSVLLDNLKSSVMDCVEYAFKKGVTLQIEPICKAETCLINNTFEAIRFLRELGNPENLGILYDTYHSNIEDEGMTEAIEAAKGFITNVHLADSNRGLPGYGTIDFQEIYKTLRNTGYKGAFTLETLSVPTEDFIKENCAQSILQIVR